MSLIGITRASAFARMHCQPPTSSGSPGGLERRRVLQARDETPARRDRRDGRRQRWHSPVRGRATGRYGTDPLLPAHRRQYVTVTNYGAAQGYSDAGGHRPSSTCAPSAWGACGDACPSTRGGRNLSTASAPGCPCCSGGIASAYRSCGYFGTHRIWRRVRSAGKAAMRGGHGRRSDQSVTRAVVRSGSTPARTNSS